MNILFMTASCLEGMAEHGVYTDLLRRLRDHGHAVYTLSPYEKRLNRPTACMDDQGVRMLHVQTGNLTKTANLIERGFATLQVERIFIRAIKHYYADIRFDLVLYSTPPITLSSVVAYVKRRDHARSYLLLKDIFPQNAVDLGMLTKRGVKGLLYRVFRYQEKRLYALSDRIGCMSPANAAYLTAHNPQIDPQRVEVCPNAVEVIDRSVDAVQRQAIRARYGIPQEAKVFVFGGNLGKPQGIDFMLSCLRATQDLEAYFLIIGSGTEYTKVAAAIEREDLRRVRLMQRIPKADYDAMVGACDVGLLFLDHRFTVPNFPSRLLAYMQAKLPVLAVTDQSCDIRVALTEGQFGWWCESNDAERFCALVQEILHTDLRPMQENAFAYLRAHYDIETACQTILHE